MLKDAALGRYVDTGSILHRTDPRIKVILCLVYVATSIMVGSTLGIILLFIATVLQFIIAKMPFGVAKSTVIPIIPIAILIFIFNVITVKTGNVLFRWKIIKITDEGAFKAALMAARIILLIMSTNVLLTLTTTPLKIADALESLFKPLKLIKVPVHELAMIMSIALRFIPTLFDETDKITKAQVSRGANYDTGSFLNRLKGYVTILVPLFVSSFKRADDLAVAMESRCYRGGDKRTKLNPLRITRRDIIVAAIFVVIATAIVLADRLV